MALTVPGYEAILSNILRDIRNLDDQADITSDSDNYIRAAAFASALEGFYQKLAWVYRQIFADTADEDEVTHEAALRGLSLKSAVAAVGQVSMTGTAGAKLLQGATMTHTTSGLVFAALADAVVGSDGVAPVSVAAQVAGAAANGLTGALTLSSPPLGVDASTSFVSTTTGGEEQEAVASLQARLLDYIKQPPAGGADYDYKRWAKETDGVTDALVLPKRRGGGTVDIVITGTDGVPSAETIAACQAHIESVCTVIGDIAVFGPSERTVDATAQVELDSGYQLADVQTAAQAAYDSLLGAIKPNTGLKRTHVEGMLTNLAGVTDRVLLTPTANVAASADSALIGWIRPGTITLSLMPS